MNNIYQILVSHLEIDKIENFILNRSIAFEEENLKIKIHKYSFLRDIIVLMIKCGNPSIKLNELDVLKRRGKCEITNYHKNLTIERFYYDCSLGGDIPIEYCNVCMDVILKFSDNAICKIGKKQYNKLSNIYITFIKLSFNDNCLNLDCINYILIKAMI